MDIRISKENPVPLHEQISGQLVLLIAARKLRLAMGGGELGGVEDRLQPSHTP